MTDEILPFITDRQCLIRGTPEWDDREDSRVAAGCILKSYGSFEELLRTRGKSAKHRALPETKSITKVIHETAKGLHKAGVMDTTTMHEFDTLTKSSV